MSRDLPEAKKRKVVERSGDALDDDLEYEVDSDTAGELASVQSESGSAREDDHSSSDDNDDDEGPKNNSNKSTEQKSTQKNKVTKQISSEEKKQRRKERKMTTKKRKLAELGDDDAVDQGYLASEIPNADQQADLLARLIRDHAPKSLSSVELADRYLPTASFLDTSDSHNGVRTLATLPTFLMKVSPREDLKIAGKEVGRPHTLLLAQSAIRVADLVRALKPALKHKQGDVAKLFGKEKLSVQTEFLKKTRVNVAVGVPGRVLALINDGALRMDRVEQVILDHSYRDAKKRGMVQIKEVTKDLVDVLGNDVLYGRLREGKCQIVLF